MGLDCGIFGYPAPGESGMASSPTKSSCVTPVINLDFLDSGSESEDEYDGVMMGKGRRRKDEDVHVRGRSRWLVTNPDPNSDSESDW